MKTKALMFGLSAVSLITPAFADVTVDITGATAFRAAALDSIRAQYLAEPIATRSFKYGFDAASVAAFNGSTRAIFIGKFPGVSGTTTIRCSFNGSVEGIRALIGGPNPTYYQPSLLDSVTATATGASLAGQGTTGVAGAVSEIAFSDVSKDATPFAANSLQPASPAAGVVVFTMVTNEGSPITNVTSQQWRSLLTTGFQPRRLFNGNPLDNSLVFATGRNDGSGTRTTYLAESGYGISTPVNQYIGITPAASDIKAIQLVPVGGTNDQDLVTAGLQLPPGSAIDAFNTANSPATPVVQSTGNASTVWAQDFAGNGGYSSGGDLRTLLGKTGGSVTVFDADGEYSFDATPINADLVSFISLSDALNVRTNSGKIIAFNGVKLDDFAVSGTDLSAADKAKVTEGVYTAWSYQQMYLRNDILSGDTVTVYDGIKNNLVLGAAGIDIDDMKAGRTADGGTVNPL